MNARPKKVFALFAIFAALGGIVATFAVPAAADSNDCRAPNVCNFGFGMPAKNGISAALSELGST
jgi:hypothetical protein